MKKMLLVPLFAVGALVSQAQAQTHCCWEGNSYNNNKGYCGPVTSGGSSTQEGTAAHCEAEYGTLTNGCSSCNVGTGEKNDGINCEGSCKWPSACETVKTDPGGLYGPVITSCSDAVQNCIDGGIYYTDAACTNWSGQGRNPNARALGCCKWDTGSECWTIWEGSEQEVEDCSGGDNTYWAGSACPNSTGGCPSGTPTYPNPSPILIGSTTASLTVLAQSGSLHISALKEARVALFDMSGKEVFSKMVPAGYSLVSLKGQKIGVYYAVVSSGSSKQTVKIVLK
jgi:hypothetical protein